MFSGNDQFEILTPDGWADFQGVMHKGARAVLRVTLANGDFVDATANHTFFSSGAPITVDEIAIGSWIDTAHGQVEVISVDPLGETEVYDLIEVKSSDHKFFLKNGIVSKNCDEFAFVQRNKQAEFWTSIQPVLSTGGSCIVTSTPKDDEDEFAKIYNGAVDTTDEYGNPRPDGLGKNGWFAVTVPWWEHPERNEEWAIPFRETLGEARFRQEFCCEFLSDDPSLIDPMILSKMKGMPPEFFTNTVRWYEAPTANHGYLVALDPSLGTGGDNAAIQVFRLPDMVQIAEWQHNRTVPRAQVRTLLQVLLYLDAVLRDDPSQHGDPDIYWTVENNSIGEAILQIIEDTGEERFPGMMVNERKRKGQTRRFRKGLNTDNKKKLSACARTKSLIESGRMTIRSESLIRELKTFISKEVTFSAKPGCHDDLVSAMLLVVRMLDVVIAWGASIGDLREHIGDDELYDESDGPMPVVM